MLIIVAFTTLLERKLLGLIQFRLGPNKVGAGGLLQPIADAIKLFKKKELSPESRIAAVYIVGPILGLGVVLILSSLIVTQIEESFWGLGVIALFVLIRINVYPILIIGWSSGRFYAWLRTLRVVRQRLSYEIILAFTILSLRFYIIRFDIHEYQSITNSRRWIFIWPLIILWLFCLLAELHRTPFDFAERESELVSGFNIEYRGFCFSLIFIAEYGIIVVLRFIAGIPFIEIGILTTRLFWLFILIWFRGTFPRSRYDYIIRICWKFIIPGRFILFIIILWRASWI